MKAEINQEWKAKFFAQYYGQKVYAISQKGYSDKVSDISFENLNWNLNWVVALKPLSAITDEDATEVAKIAYPGEDDEYPIQQRMLGFNTARLFNDVTSFKTKINVMYVLQAADFLRSKGYALPFMGLSVEELETAGWIKLANT